jgi:hypothetical protein
MPPYRRAPLKGTFTLSPAGELVLELVERCTVIKYVERKHAYFGGICTQIDLDAIPVKAVTPWRQEVRGVWTDAGHISFRADWAQTGLDPLSEEAVYLTAQPWSIASTWWNPSKDEAAQVLQLIGKALQTEPDLVRGGPAPQLEVAAVGLSEGPLRSGSTSTLMVRIVNRGPGTAYRVLATTRSSLRSLHGHRLGFGMIKPGAEKVRTLRVVVPPSETAPDAMLVLAVEEGNGFIPPNVSRRVPILASMTAPMLATRCKIAGRPNSSPDLDAGESIVLNCVVDNTGTVAANVILEATVTNGRAVSTLARTVAAGGQVAIDVPLTIPLGLALDAEIEIAVLARDTVFARTARASIPAIIRRSRMCEVGKLTADEYRAEIAELRAASSAGYITQAQLDRYDAELVGCLP